jgi:hypothetical protein
MKLKPDDMFSVPSRYLETVQLRGSELLIVTGLLIIEAVMFLTDSLATSVITTWSPIAAKEVPDRFEEAADNFSTRGGIVSFFTNTLNSPICRPSGETPEISISLVIPSVNLDESTASMVIGPEEITGEAPLRICAPSHWAERAVPAGASIATSKLEFTIEPLRKGSTSAIPEIGGTAVTSSVISIEETAVSESDIPFLKAAALTVALFERINDEEYTIPDENVGVFPSRVYLMAAPGVAQEIETACGGRYLPEAGVITGLAAAARFSPPMSYIAVTTLDGVIPSLYAIAFRIVLEDIFSADE